MKLIEITDAEGTVVEAGWLARAEAVHRQLRPQLPADYAAVLARIFAQGARMVIACEGEAVCGLAVWRCHENTYSGLHVYVDDLVSDAGRRSQGVGRALIDWLSVRARVLGCQRLTLDSGTQRVDAHRFYLRERFEISAFHFIKNL